MDEQEQSGDSQTQEKKPISLTPKTLNKKLMIAVMVVFVFVITGMASAYFVLIKKNDVGQACTLEAKICPDGSAVGRSGPNCEFAECPSVEPQSSADTSNWQTYRNEEYGFEFRYPDVYRLKDDDFEPVYSYRDIIYLFHTELGRNYSGMEGGPPTISVIIHSNPAHLTALDWAKSNEGYSNFLGKYTEVYVAEQKAMSYHWEGIGGGDRILLSDKSDDFIIILDASSNSGGVEIKEDFLDIVSTFKFIE